MSYRDKNRHPRVVLGFRNESSRDLGSPGRPRAGPWARGAAGPPAHSHRDPGAARPGAQPLPVLGPQVWGWRLLPGRRGRGWPGEGERVARGRPGGRLVWEAPARSTWSDGRGRGAEPAAAGRGRLGHALFIAAPSARRPRPLRLRLRSGSGGSGERRSLHNIVAAPVTAPGGAASAAGCGGEGSRRGRFWVTGPRGGSDSQGVGVSSGGSL